MRIEYIPLRVERFIQKFLNFNSVFKFNKYKFDNKYYCLSMFPYPSGKLHIGHIRNYTIGDIISGYKRLQGYYVLNPIGWDSFGLPAENAAYKNNTTPDSWTYCNIKVMRRQLKRLGFSFNWNREITTSKSDYYKWEQLLFIKLFNSGLVYKKKSYVNWDPLDCTVLANEQVIDGKGWRSNVNIERKKISQWYLKISDYANILFSDLGLLLDWPSNVVEMQKKWINKRIGYYIKFKSAYSNFFLSFFFEKLDDLCWLYSINLSKEHILLDFFYKRFFLINPITFKKIFISFIDLSSDNFNDLYRLYFHQPNKINFYLILFNNLKKKVFKNVIFNLLYSFRLIFKGYKFSLKDWCISRQRYWGAPIPIIFCGSCGVLPEKSTRIPVLLPKISSADYKNFSLKNFSDFFFTECYICKSKAFRETDTFDTFVESSWYYVRYISDIIDPDNLNSWLPVDQYIGGIEHATMHLIYSRFLHKVMNDFGMFKCKEPFSRLLTQGMVLMGGSKMSKSKGNVVNQEDLISKYGADALRLFVIFAAPPEQSFEWDVNGINGCKRFLDQIWNFSVKLKFFEFESQIKYDCLSFSDDIVVLIREFNSILDKIYFNLFKVKAFNVVISFLMIVLNKISRIKIVYNFDRYALNIIFEAVLILLSPIAPHITNYIWLVIFQKRNLIIYEKMPTKFVGQFFDDNLFCLTVQINNKFKKNFYFPYDLSEDKIINEVLDDNDIKRLISPGVKRVVYKKFKTINIILV